MRAHCINFYDDNASNYAGDLWITNVRQEDTFHMDLSGVEIEDGMLDLNLGQVRQLKEACDTFIAERVMAHVALPLPSRGARIEGDHD